MHLLIHKHQNGKETPIMACSGVITSLCAIPLQAGLNYFPPLCWASTLIKGKNPERNQALKAFIDYVKQFIQDSNNKWVKNKQGGNPSFY